MEARLPATFRHEISFRLRRPPAPGSICPGRGRGRHARGGGRDRRGAARRRADRAGQLTGNRGRPGRYRPHAAAGQELRHFRVRYGGQDRAARRDPGGARPVRRCGRHPGGAPARVRHVGARAVRLHRPVGRPDQARLHGGVPLAHPGRRGRRGVRAGQAGRRGETAERVPGPAARPGRHRARAARPVQARAADPGPAGPAGSPGRAGSRGRGRNRSGGGRQPSGARPAAVPRRPRPGSRTVLGKPPGTPRATPLPSFPTPTTPGRRPAGPTGGGSWSAAG